MQGHRLGLDVDRGVDGRVGAQRVDHGPGDEGQVGQRRAGLLLEPVLVLAGAPSRRCRSRPRPRSTPTPCRSATPSSRRRRPAASGTAATTSSRGSAPAAAGAASGRRAGAGARCGGGRRGRRSGCRRRAPAGAAAAAWPAATAAFARPRAGSARPRRCRGSPRRPARPPRRAGGPAATASGRCGRRRSGAASRGAPAGAAAGAAGSGGRCRREPARRRRRRRRPVPRPARRSGPARCRPARSPRPGPGSPAAPRRTGWGSPSRPCRWTPRTAGRRRLDRVADLLEPAADRALGDGLAELGHGDVVHLAGRRADLGVLAGHALRAAHRRVRRVAPAPARRPRRCARVAAAGTSTPACGAWRHRAARRPDPDQRGAHRHGLPGRHQDLHDHAVVRAGDLRVDLVGGHLEQRIVEGHLVAGLLEPAADRALGDRLAQLGHRHDPLVAHRSPLAVPQPCRERPEKVIMVSPMASERLGWAWISRPTSSGSASQFTAR